MLVMIREMQLRRPPNRRGPKSRKGLTADPDGAKTSWVEEAGERRAATISSSLKENAEDVANSTKMGPPTTVVTDRVLPHVRGRIKARGTLIKQMKRCSRKNFSAA